MTEITLEVADTPEFSVDLIAGTAEVTVNTEPVEINVELCGTGVLPSLIEVGRFPAAEDIGGERAVGIDDNGELIPADALLGIPARFWIRNAVTAGEITAVYQHGVMNGFTGLAVKEEYYLGENGLPVLTPPDGGMIQTLGNSVSETQMALDIEEPVYLN